MDSPPTTVRARVRDALEHAWNAAEAAGTLPHTRPTTSDPPSRWTGPPRPSTATWRRTWRCSWPGRSAGRPGDRDRPRGGARDDGHGYRRARSPKPSWRRRFINLRLSDAVLTTTIDPILAAPASWGRVAPLRTRAVNVEFVSANPTGPLTIGNARGAFVGDLLCRVLAAGGQRVTRDLLQHSGGQIDKLGGSVLALRRGEPVAEDGYHGDYVADLASSIPSETWAAATADDADPTAVLGHWAAEQYIFGLFLHLFVQLHISLAGVNVAKVDYCGGFFIALIGGTNTFRISGALDATTWDPLDFAQITVFPGNLLSMKVDHNEIWLWSGLAATVYYLSGNPNFPFDLNPSAQVIEGGIAAINSVVQLDNTIFWVGKDTRGRGVIWRASGYTPTRVSNHAVEYAISQYGDISDAVAYSYQDQGHAFYVLFFPTAEVLPHETKTSHLGL